MIVWVFPHRVGLAAQKYSWERGALTESLNYRITAKVAKQPIASPESATTASMSKRQNM